MQSTYPGFLHIQVKFFHRSALNILLDESLRFFFQLLWALSSSLYEKSSVSDGYINIPFLKNNFSELIKFLITVLRSAVWGGSTGASIGPP
jgi:hypothetical protein